MSVRAFVLFLLCPGLAFAASNHTIAVDGTCSDWTSDEKFPLNDNRDVWLTWDTASIFVAFHGGDGTERRIIAFNTNPGVDDGTLTSYNGVNFPRNGTPEFIVEVTGGELFFTSRNGSSQTLDLNPPGSSVATGTCGGSPFLEVQLPRALFNNALAPADDLSIIAWWASASAMNGTVSGALPASCNTSGATPKDYALWLTFADTLAVRSPTTFGTVSTPSVTVLTAPPSGASGQQLMFTATVFGQACGGTRATGTATFYDGNTVIGTAMLSNGVATFSTTALGVGLHAISAGWPGMTGLTSSRSAARTVTINKAQTQTSLMVSSNPALYGSSVTFTATVSSLSGGAAPSGQVTFEADGTTVGSAMLDGNGVASIAIDTLPTGFHAIVARFAGTASADPSASNAFQLYVDKKTVMLALSVTPMLTYNESATLTATISTSPGGAAPTGTIVFSVDGQQVGGSPVTNGMATFNTMGLQPGQRTFSAAYLGDANHNNATSPSVMRIVQPAMATIAFTAAPQMATAGEAVTMRATVSSTRGVPDGQVSFLWNGNGVGTPMLDGVGEAQQAITLPVGTHQLSARYEGSLKFAPVTSSAVTITVSQVASTVVLAVSPSPSALSQRITLTATVTSGNRDPTGAVIFKDGTTSIGGAFVSSGMASMTIASLTAGTHALSAEYAGDAEVLAGTSNVVMHEVIDGLPIPDAGSAEDASVDDAGPEVPDAAVPPVVDAAVEIPDAAVAVIDASVVEEPDAAVTRDAAVTPDAAVAMDAGTMVTTDAAVADAVDAGTPPSNPDTPPGCGCSESVPSDVPVSVVAMLLVMLRLRRRG